jgi:5-methylcytosine-specific restriction endonuclease McrA
MTTFLPFTQLSNRELLDEVKRLAAEERRATAELIACLTEVDERRLYLGEGCSSLFTYCTQVLHLSEHAAYGRIEAARAARRFPGILTLLADGAITLTSVCLLAPHLTTQNHDQVLTAARHKTKREVEELVAEIRPRPDVRASIRKALAPKSAIASRTTDTQESLGTKQANPPSMPVAVVAPLAPERYRLQFTVDRKTLDKLRRAQDLLRHSVPTGDPAAVFDRALTLLLAELERTRLAATNHPRTAPVTLTSRSRHIPAAVKRVVWTRDKGRCAFVGQTGRCTETGFLQFHHVVPYAVGGRSVTENIQLRCAAHNAHEAEVYFGPRQPSLMREEAPAYVINKWHRCCVNRFVMSCGRVAHNTA